MPLAITYHYLGKQAIVDPTIEEESVSFARITISMNVFGDICGIRSNGSMELDPDDINKLIELTSQAVSEQTSHIRSLLKENKPFLNKEKARMIQQSKNTTSAL